MNEMKLPHHHHDETEAMFDHMPKPEEFSAAADLFRLMGDNTRLKLFWLLCHCEECLQNLSVMMEMSSPALSHHLKILKACRLAVSRREGKEVYYRAAESPQAQAMHLMIEQMAEISCPEASARKKSEHRTGSKSIPDSKTTVNGQ